ncbi:ice-binding family protein [Glaciihabitans sp. dw_435]|uniref:ice-binding family protein n=1 Tax=Glaciihabitans sp. dw_435 TaxID=2720081 RepID=UPI001BD2F292|nr:ice-binding family protein [Glaciihabitans sp. dw_435]
MTARSIRMKLEVPLALALAIAAGTLLVLSGGTPAHAAESSVGLGTAESFSVLGATAVTNTLSTTVQGDLGVSPGSSITGFPPGLVSNGTVHTTDAVAAQAQAAVTTAYNDAAGRSPLTSGLGDLAGLTLVPGVYSGNELGLTGTVTLAGDASSVFIFQAASTLITASASRVVLTGGASACNVYWQVGSSATLGTASTFFGTILAQASVTATTGATITGRLFARTGAVTLDSNVINRPTGCTAVAAPVPSVSATPSATPTPVATPSATPRPTASAVPSTTPSVSPSATPGSGTGNGGGGGNGNGNGNGTGTDTLAETGADAIAPSIVGASLLLIGAILLAYRAGFSSTTGGRGRHSTLRRR